MESLILGHSFIHRLEATLDPPYNKFLDVDHLMHLEIYGVSGLTIDKLLQHHSHVLSNKHRDLLILELGTNDLDSSRSGKDIALDMATLLHSLLDDFHFKHVVVCQVMKRSQTPRMKSVQEMDVDILQYNDTLEHLLHKIPNLHFWHHRGFTAPPIESFSEDGLHITTPQGINKYQRSIRQALVYGAGKLLSSC